MKDGAKVIPLIRRSPEEIAAFHDGFNAGIRMAVDAISTNKQGTESRGNTFRDGMDYAAQVIEMNADAFRRMTKTGAGNERRKSFRTDED